MIEAMACDASAGRRVVATVQPVETCRRVKFPIRAIRVRFHREVSGPLKAVTKKRPAERCGQEAALMNELRASRTTMELLGLDEKSIAN